MSKLELILNDLVKSFNEKAIAEIQSGSFYAKGKDKVVNVTTNQIKNALKKICPQDDIKKIAEDMLKHFNNLEKLIPFCSSPGSFRSAWELRSRIFNKFDADTLVNEGAQLIPINKQIRLFQPIQQGVELDKSKRFVSFVRHSEGNYDDDFIEGEFEYQPPSDATGMLRYRWCQFLSNQLGLPFIVIAVMWFEYRINDVSNIVFIAAPAKIKESNDLQNFNDSLSNPLKLKIINRIDAYNAINLLTSLNQTNLETMVRKELPLSLAREYAYERINSSVKGKQIKKWAQKKIDKTCPDGRVCNHKKFNQFDLKDIAFGHIVSQRWTDSFTFLLDKRDHPDNLYLTCKNCNSSLNDQFPDAKLRAEIEKQGTIGDWLREYEHEIREI